MDFTGMITPREMSVNHHYHGLTMHLIDACDTRRLAEGSNATSLELRQCVRISLAEEEFFLLRQLTLVLLVILKAWAPLGARVSVIALLPERLLGLIEGSL